MTILKCSATTCAYNEDMLCSRGEINVMGDSAKSSEETSCGSFREKSQGAMNSAKNSCGCETIQNAIPLNASARACLKEAFCKNFSNRFQKIAANSKTAPAQMCEGLLISIHYLFLKKSGIWISFF